MSELWCFDDTEDDLAMHGGGGAVGANDAAWGTPSSACKARAHSSDDEDGAKPRGKKRGRPPAGKPAVGAAGVMAAMGGRLTKKRVAASVIQPISLLDDEDSQPQSIDSDVEEILGKVEKEVHRGMAQGTGPERASGGRGAGPSTAARGAAAAATAGTSAGGSGGLAATHSTTLDPALSDRSRHALAMAQASAAMLQQLEDSPDSPQPQAPPQEQHNVHGGRQHQHQQQHQHVSGRTHDSDDDVVVEDDEHEEGDRIGTAGTSGGALGQRQPPAAWMGTVGAATAHDANGNRKAGHEPVAGGAAEAFANNGHSDRASADDGGAAAAAAPPAQQESAGDKVVLKCQLRDNSQVMIKLGRREPFSKLMARFAQHAVAKGLARSEGALRYRFEGDPLPPDETPEELDMEDGFTIDVHVVT